MPSASSAGSGRRCCGESDPRDTGLPGVPKGIVSETNENAPGTPERLGFRQVSSVKPTKATPEAHLAAPTPRCGIWFLRW